LKKIRIKLLNTEAKLPLKATEHSSGFDLVSCEDITINKHSYGMVSTGISIELDPGMEAQVRPRSGLAIKHGITVLNSPGTIDADYRGEVKVLLINHSDQDFLISKGMRIAQMVFAVVTDVQLEESSDISDTVRGAGGFGSTGIH
jgi:dUTP pyrophosphatase